MRHKSLTFRVAEDLWEEAVRASPSRLRRSVSAIVQAGLKLFIVQQKRERFAKSMRQMARDPQARAINRQINKEFEPFDNDGFKEARG